MSARGTGWLAAALLLAPPALRAATPTQVHLEGWLATVGGDPVTATLPMTFGLYDAPEGGDALWTERQEAVEVVGGRFAVLLGASAWLEQDLLDRALWVGVAVGEGAAPELVPRIELAGAGFALRAARADVADNLADPSGPVAAVRDRIVGDPAALAAVRGATGAAGAPGADGADGAHCYDGGLLDTDGDGALTAADCRGGAGPPGGPGPGGADGLDCWDAVGDTDLDGELTIADCQGPAGPPGPAETPSGLFTSLLSREWEERRLGLVGDDVGELSTTIRVDERGTVVDAGVRLGYGHGALTEVVVELISPSETVVTLWSQGPGADLTGWAGEGFAPVDSLATLEGEPAYGDWTLVVRDVWSPGQAGTLEEWALALDLVSERSVELGGALEVVGDITANQGDFDSVRLGDADVMEARRLLAGRLNCLETCNPALADDCRPRGCDEDGRNCHDLDPSPDGTACDGGRGRCADGACCHPDTTCATEDGGARCGRTEDGCDGQVWCGLCDGDQVCDAGLCRSPVCEHRWTCPAHPLGWPVQRNARDHCQYAPADDPLAAEIFVRPGAFPMGTPEGEEVLEWENPAAERPVTPVAFARGFFIGRYEATAARFAACQQAGACGGGLRTGDYDPPRWGVNTPGNGRGSHPQNGVSWHRAREFCGWIGGRLPSESEWEYAATGPVHTKWPWGDEPAAACGYGSLHDGQTFGCGSGGTQPVGSHPDGASHVGAEDMVGSVGEWCEDCAHAGNLAGIPTDGSPWDSGCDASGYKVARGASVAQGANTGRTSWRGSVWPSYGAMSNGFRCARDLP